MAAAADGILLVVKVGSTRPRELVRAKELLERAGDPIVGVVLNRTPVKSLNNYYKQYVPTTKPNQGAAPPCGRQIFGRSWMRAPRMLV